MQHGTRTSYDNEWGLALVRLPALTAHDGRGDCCGFGGGSLWGTGCDHDGIVGCAEGVSEAVAPADSGTIAMVLCGDKARTYLFLMDRARQRQVKTAMRKRRFGGQDAACTAGAQQVKPNQGGRQRQRASYGR